MCQAEKFPFGVIIGDGISLHEEALLARQEIPGQDKQAEAGGEV